MDMTLYGTDLAAIHADGFGAFVRNAGAELVRLFRETIGPGGTVVDLGCGDGTFLMVLRAAGFCPVGVEPSPAFLHLAARNAPGVPLHHSSAHDFDFPPCAAVTALGEVLGYLPADAGEPEPPLPDLFGRVAAALQPGGWFVFDLYAGGPEPLPVVRSWRCGADWAVLVETTENPDARLLTRAITSFRREETGLYRQSEETHRLRIHDPAEVTAWLAAAGLSVTTTDHYGASPLLPRRLGFLARRG